MNLEKQVAKGTRLKRMFRNPTYSHQILTIMAVVTLNPMFNTSSGLLERAVTKNGHTHGENLLTKHRVAATTNPNCQRAYTYGAGSYKRSTPVTADETARRTRFGVVGAAVAARMQDLTKITQDQASFAAQRDLPGGKKTMKSYIWSLELAVYDQQH